MQLQYYVKIDTEFPKLSSNRVSLIRFRSPVTSLSAEVLSLRGCSPIRETRDSAGIRYLSHSRSWERNFDDSTGRLGQVTTHWKLLSVTSRGWRNGSLWAEQLTTVFTTHFTRRRKLLHDAVKDTLVLAAITRRELPGEVPRFVGKCSHVELLL